MNMYCCICIVRIMAVFMKSGSSFSLFFPNSFPSAEIISFKTHEIYIDRSFFPLCSKFLPVSLKTKFGLI